MPRPYASSSYDDDFCLKPPLMLWVVVLYLCRALLLPIAVAIGSVAGLSAESITLLRGLWTPEAVLPSLLAVSVLYALCRRVPGASRRVRWLWARGQIFLVVAAVSDLVLSLIVPIQQREINDQVLSSLSAATIDAYFLLYLLLARRVRDAFADFPLPLDPARR